MCVQVDTAWFVQVSMTYLYWATSHLASWGISYLIYLRISGLTRGIKSNTRRRTWDLNFDIKDGRHLLEAEFTRV